MEPMLEFLIKATASGLQIRFCRPNGPYFACDGDSLCEGVGGRGWGRGHKSQSRLARLKTVSDNKD